MNYMIFQRKNKLIHIQKQRYQRFVKNKGGYTRAKVYLVSLPALSLYISIKFKPFSNRALILIALVRLSTVFSSTPTPSSSEEFLGSTIAQFTLLFSFHQTLFYYFDSLRIELQDLFPSWLQLYGLALSLTYSATIPGLSRFRISIFYFCLNYFNNYQAGFQFRMLNPISIAVCSQD